MTYRAFILFFVLFRINASAQVINKPSIAAKSEEAADVQINRVELTGESAIIDFNVRQQKGTSFVLSSNTYIMPSEGGEKLYLKNAIGISIDSPVKATRNSIQNFKLIFPRPGNNVKLINFHGETGGDNWNIFEIDIDPVENSEKVIEVPAKGNKLVDGVLWRFINNPSYEAKSDVNYEITKVELSYDQTILFFEVTGMYDDWIIVPKESYIQPSEGGDKLYIESAEGTRIAGEEYSGVMFVRLYFPALDSSVSKINVKVLGYNRNWSVFELDVDKD